MTALTDHPVFLDGHARTEASSSFGGTGVHGGPVPARLVLSQHHLRECAVLSARGEIDISTVAQLERAANRLLADASGRLILDLSETSFMDLSGVHAAERLSRLAAAGGGGFAVVAVTWEVRRVLALGAHPWLAITADLAEALEVVADRGGGGILSNRSGQQH
jgi:anti-anti-sigma factor